MAEPIRAAAGTRIVHTTVYDNSSANPANPDPTRVVHWGLQSADEMLYGSFFFRWENGTAENPVHDELNFQIAQLFGTLDNDFNGVLSVDEMPNWLKKPFETGKFDHFNKDKNDTLSRAEYRAFSEYRRAERAKQKAAQQEEKVSDD